MTVLLESIEKRKMDVAASNPNRHLHRRHMRALKVVLRELDFIAAPLCLLLVNCPACGSTPDMRPATAPPSLETVDVFRTNWVPRVITNVIEVRLPANVFISEYRTSRFEALRTNVIDVYRTNWVTKTMTNTITVEKTQTNLATRFQTNVNTLNLTNWEMVVLFKTNWVTQPITNLVEVNMPVASTEPAKPAVATEAKAPEPAPSLASGATAGWVLEAARTGKPPANNLFEVQLDLKPGSAAAAALPLQEWRVERANGSVLLLGQGRELKLELPLGTFNVEVKARQAENTPPMRVRGTVTVTREGVSSRILP
jgi:hypothetical protein